MAQEEKNSTEVLENQENNEQTSDNLENNQNENAQNEDQKPSEENIETLPENGEPQQDDIIQKKAKKINKLLFIIIGILSFLIIIGAILFFLGVFEPEPEPIVQDGDNPTDTQTLTQEPQITLPSYKFDINDINVPRLNNQLLTLLQTTPNSESTPSLPSQDLPKIDESSFYDDELENLFSEQTIPTQVEQIEEPIAIISLDAEEGDITLLEQDLTDTQESPQQIIELVDNKSTITEDKEENIIPLEENGENQFLKFIQVATLKYKLYTQFLRQIEAVDARISICQNETGRIQIFIGPFLDDDKRAFVIEQINKNIVNDAFGLEFTQEEFNKRCGINDPS